MTQTGDSIHSHAHAVADIKRMLAAIDNESIELINPKSFKVPENLKITADNLAIKFNKPMQIINMGNHNLQIWHKWIVDFFRPKQIVEYEVLYTTEEETTNADNILHQQRNASIKISRT